MFNCSVFRRSCIHLLSNYIRSAKFYLKKITISAVGLSPGAILGAAVVFEGGIDSATDLPNDAVVEDAAGVTAEAALTADVVAPRDGMAADVTVKSVAILKSAFEADPETGKYSFGSVDNSNSSPPMDHKERIPT